MLWVKVPDKIELYYLEYKEFKAIFRSLNGHDLFYLEENDFELNSLTSVYKLIERLLVSTKDDLTDLALEDFNDIIKILSKNLIEKNLLKPEAWFELVFIAGGKQFSSDWQKWQEMPIPILLGMSNIAKKYLQTL